MPHIGVCRLKSQLCSCFWLPANADPEEATVMGQVRGALPSAWEIWVEFLAPSFSLLWFWFLQEFGEPTSTLLTPTPAISPYRTVSLPFKEMKSILFHIQHLTSPSRHPQEAGFP